jgi:LPPG:FO 2-phospho-L-lactate transferase
VQAVRAADLVVIGPSNPLLSVDPITALIGPHLERERVIAIAPIIGGRALKGPTVALMAQLGEEPTALGVAHHYAGLASGFVLDAADRDLSDAVARLGMSPHVLDIVMAGAQGEERLARQVLALRDSAAH